MLLPGMMKGCVILELNSHVWSVMKDSLVNVVAACHLPWLLSAEWYWSSQKKSISNYLILNQLLFNSWGRASVPRVIAGTRICKLVTCSLVVDGHQVEGSPNSRVRRSIISEEAHAHRTSVWSNLMRTCIVCCSDSEFSLCQISTPRLEVLPNLRHAGVFQMSTMVNFGIGLTRRWAFALRLRKITGDIQIPACWKVIWKWENIMSCYS